MLCKICGGEVRFLFVETPVTDIMRSEVIYMLRRKKGLTIAASNAIVKEREDLGEEFERSIGNDPAEK